MPHFILGDHGTDIVEGHAFSSVAPLQESIARTWNCGNQTLRDLLQNDPGLQLQPIDPRYRVAYYYDPSRLQSETLEKIHKAGFDPLLSCEMYLDILPRGVNKGSSLVNLLNHLNINHELAITSGDSLNDYPLFQTGLKGIAVGNSEPKLKEKVKELPNVYQSPLPGVLGIMDGLNHFERMAPFLP